MGLVPRDLELSRRRAPAREAVLVYLHVVRRAGIGEISEATGVRPSRVVGIMEGAPYQYAADLSLSAQRAARVIERRDARCYEITELGDRVACETLERLGLTPA